MSAVAAIVLAAGEGARFGGPKALAVTQGRSWVEIAVELLRAAAIDPIVVVVGADAGAVRAVMPAGAHVVDNPDWPSGRTGSLQRGLRALPAAAGAVIVHQVDFPEVRSATVTTLARAFDSDPSGGDRIFVPVLGGRRGHPILLGRAIWPEVERLRPDEPLRTVIHRDPARVVEVAIADPGIHDNRNHPVREDG